MKTIKAIFLMAFMLLVSSQFTKAQVSFSHSAGAGYYTSQYAGAPGVMYSPRLNLVELGDEFTLSLGTHIGLGLSYNSREGASSLALDLPLMAEANFGHAANPETSSSVGGFAGVGYGISRIGSAGAFGADYNKASGVVFNGGIRFIIPRVERSIGLRASYLLNFTEGYGNVLGIGVLYNFGEY